MTSTFATRTLLIVALGMASLARTGAQTPAPKAATLSVPGRTNANVSLTARGAVVVATWAASLPTGATDIYAAVSHDRGTVFGPPVRVNSTEGDAHVTGEQPPRVVLRDRADSSPEIVVVWTSKNNVGGTIVSATSSDFGKSFSPTAVAAGAEGAGNRGWENATVDRLGQVHLVWLDHRELAQAGTMSHTAEHHMAPADSKNDAVATAQMSKLYTSTLGERGSAHAITGGVCYCCKTAIVAGGENDIYLAWRQVYAGNIRDMAFTASHDGGRTFAGPVRVSEDQWKIEGCPEDGPALALDAKRQVHVVWPTLVHDTPNGQPSIGIFYSNAADRRRFSARQRVPTEGVPHHPQITIDRDGLVLAWDELNNGARQVVVGRRTLNAGAAASWSRRVVSGNVPGTYPALAAIDQGVLVAWTASGPSSAIRIASLDKF